MKIKNRILALALVPFPALLYFSWVVGQDNARELRAARATNAAWDVVAAADEVAAALTEERRLAADGLAAGEVTLDALLLSQDGAADVLSASASEDLERQRVQAERSTGERLERYAAVLGEADAARQSPQFNAGLDALSDLFTQLPSLRGRMLAAANLQELLQPYEHIAQRIGDLHEYLALAAGDTAAARLGGARTALARMRNLIENQNLVVYFALVSRQLTPEQVRIAAELGGRLHWQTRQFEDVYGDPEKVAALRAVLRQADEGGRGAVLDAMQAFGRRQDDLATVLRAMGYGGAIHSFQNYILRRDPKYRSDFERDYRTAISVLEQVRAQPGLGPREREDLDTVRETFETYARNAADVAKLVKRGWSVTQIDQALRVDDEPAREALQRLLAFDPAMSASQWIEHWHSLTRGLQDFDREVAAKLQQRITALESAAARARMTQIIFLILTLTFALGIALVLALRLSSGFTEMVAEFQRIASTGDLASDLPASGTDELAELLRAVQAINARIALVADAATRMAVGDYGSAPEPLGPQDRLALAVQEMGTNARGVIRQAERIAQGDYSADIAPRSAADDLGRALAEMTASLRRFTLDNEAAQWLNRGRLALFEALRGQPPPKVLAERLLAALADYIHAAIGLVYLREAEGVALYGRYAVPETADLPRRVGPGDGQIGQAFLSESLRLIEPLPENYLTVRSGSGSAAVRHLALLPLRSGGEAVGVLELGFLTAPDPRALELLRSSAETLAVALAASVARAETERLLTETQEQAERLKSQQEELRTANEEMEEQTQMLRQSEEELKSQREELQTTNEELLEKGSLLEKQKVNLEKNAVELEQATRYKSEFLANMSHELRTPLNSLLILSKQLAANEEANLNADQVESARVIYEGGRDLLNLINDILDLSKVEAGRLDMHPEPFPLRALLGPLREYFTPVARQKKLELRLELDGAAPPRIDSDRQRVQQVLRNLLSNALKFTHRGTVAVDIARPPVDMVLRRPGLVRETAVAFTVSDTGIGIPAEKLGLIFEAFHQADGSTSRKYGGTGLGLTISRQFAGLLGGEIHVSSTPGQGSRFTLVLPEKYAGAVAAEAPAAVVATPVPALPEPLVDDSPPDAAPIEDDRLQLKSGERSLLIVEDDLRYAAIMRDLARKRGYKCLVADTAASGLRLARRYRPSGVVLDLGLPDADGMTVLEALKASPTTRHIPVHIVSATAASIEPLARGAIGFLAKPASKADLLKVIDKVEDRVARTQRAVLVIEDDRASQHAVRRLLENEQTRVLQAGTAAAAMELLEKERVDCIVLDLSLPDTDGLDFLRKLKADEKHAHPPVVVYTARDLTSDEHRELSALAQSIVVKGAQSPERLLDEVLLFLHTLTSTLPEPQRQAVARVRATPDAFKGKKLLLVDDDLRNTFALSAALKKHGFEILIADNGQLALQRLNERPDVDLVLMDIMMPVMDGFEAMKRIRAQERFKNLPIVALTAKAMAEDRRKCMDAGATDYLTKPVDVDQLLAAIRLWLGRAA